MTFCPYCGVRPDVDLRQIHFRDLGEDAALTCPVCAVALGVIEFDVEPKIRIERCTTCYGMFFNPGELQVLLEAQTNPLVWLDPVELNQIAADCDREHAVVYRKCPVCAERMSPLNFGGHSGVILDSCGTHGVWLEGSELRRLTEWWRAGGKLIYQNNEAERVKQLYAPLEDASLRTRSGTIESSDLEESWSWNSPTASPTNGSLWSSVIGTIVSCILK